MVPSATYVVTALQPCHADMPQTWQSRVAFSCMSDPAEAPARSHVHAGFGSECRPVAVGNGEIPTPLRDLIPSCPNKSESPYLTRRLLARSQRVSSLGRPPRCGTTRASQNRGGDPRPLFSRATRCCRGLGSRRTGGPARAVRRADQMGAIWRQARAARRRCREPPHPRPGLSRAGPAGAAPPGQPATRARASIRASAGGMRARSGLGVRRGAWARSNRRGRRGSKPAGRPAAGLASVGAAADARSHAARAALASQGRTAEFSALRTHRRSG